MEVRYPKQHAKQGPHNRFQFESDRITLNVPQGSLNGWEIIPLNATVVSSACTYYVVMIMIYYNNYYS